MCWELAYNLDTYLSYSISPNVSQIQTVTHLSAVFVQARGSEAAHILASGCLGNSSTLQHPSAGCPEGQGPGRAQEAEPQRPPQAEPG